MEKGIILIGPRKSGKTLLLNEYKEAYGEKAVYIPGRRKNLFDDTYMFSECTEKTEVIIIDDLSESNIDGLIPLVSDPIKVNQPMKHPFTINIDKVVVAMDSSVKVKAKQFDESFSRRFQIIRLKQSLS